MARRQRIEAMDGLILVYMAALASGIALYVLNLTR